jgi:hypothetical protein
MAHSLDLSAEILPRVAAGGFSIGMDIAEIADLLSNSVSFEYVPGFDLVAAINANAGILSVRGLSPTEGCVVFFGPDTVRLVFNRLNKLGCIYVFSGYRGTYRSVAIGAPLSALRAFEQLEFDHGDEMYYRVDKIGTYVPGLSILAGDETVDGFCVHNWSLFNEGGT